MVERTRSSVTDELRLAEKTLGDAAVRSVVESAPRSRDELLADEARTLAELASGTGDVSAFQPRALQEALRVLRSTESDLDFQSELLEAQMGMAASSGYSRDNFAYGSTPLCSWLHVFKHVATLLAEAAEPVVAVRYAVLGSSLGSLCVFGACVFGWEARGIEVMPLLWERAKQMASVAGVKGVRFECADLLRCDLRGERVLLLASQCWDDQLVRAVQAKLLDEAAEGALIVDYTAALGRSTDHSADRPYPVGAEVSSSVAGAEASASVSVQSLAAASLLHTAVEWSSQGSGLTNFVSSPLSADGESHRRRFELVAKVRAPVSWSGACDFFIWRMRGAARNADQVAAEQ